MDRFLTKQEYIEAGNLESLKGLENNLLEKAFNESDVPASRLETYVSKQYGKSVKDFLTAYGYTMSDDKGGRPKADHNATFEALKLKYPNGADFNTLGEFVEANPDISKKLKTLQNVAPQILEMSFAKWLKENGIIK
jgi:hypothetical protein